MRIKIHKNAEIIAGLSFMFLLLISVVGVKYLPFFTHRTILYCQEMLQKFNLVNIPIGFNVTLLAVVFFLSAFFSFIVLKKARELYILSKSLNKNKVKIPKSIKPIIFRMDIKHDVVVFSDQKPIAFCFGFFNAKIYLSTTLIEIVTPGELHTILLHERHHLKKRDNLLLLWVDILESILPFIPILKDLAQNLRIQLEIEADRAAIVTHQSQKTIISVLRKLLIFEYPAVYTMLPRMVAHDTLKARIESLVGKKQAHVQISLFNMLISTASLITLLFLLIKPIHAVDLHSGRVDMIMACADKNGCASWCQNNSQKILQMSPAINFSAPYTPSFSITP